MKKQIETNAVQHFELDGSSILTEPLAILYTTGPVEKIGEPE
jgi:hypothetical protein